MIIRNRPRFWELIGIWRLSILPRIAPQLACIIAWSCLVVWISNRYPGLLRAWTVTPFTLLGVALSMFLSFRNSACYDRWWEARRQLGALVAETRSFARICGRLPKADQAMREALLADTTTFASQLMDSLRRKSSPPGTRTLNTPDFMLRSLGRRTS